MKVAEYKKRKVEELSNLIKGYPIIGIVNMENLPAPQLQRMRAQLRDKLVLTMTKKRLIRIALNECKEAKKGVDRLAESFTGMPAMVFTKENPFRVASMLRKSKSSAPAKPGQTAPRDIIIPAGPTPFAPGPIISELSSIGLKTAVEGGKVAIKQESLVAKEGEKIKPKVADVLAKLGVEPMEVGLDLVAIYEGGVIYKKDVLSVDEATYLNNIRLAASQALNLSVEISYITKDNIKLLLGGAFSAARHIAFTYSIISDEVVKGMLAEAEQQALGMKEQIRLPEETKEEPKAEIKEKPLEVKKEEPAKVEEKPAEEKPETKKEEPEEEKKVEEPAEVKKETQAKLEPKKEEPKAEKLGAPKEEPAKPKEEAKPKTEHREPITKDKELIEKEIDEKIEELRKRKAGGKEVDLSQGAIEKLAEKLRKEGTLRGGEMEEKSRNKEDIRMRVDKDFKEDIQKEKERRSKVDDKAVEDLMQELKRKGTLRK